jgi:hypothetical protein
MLRVEEPKAPAVYDKDEEKRKEYTANTKKWERANCMSAMIMKNSIFDNVWGAISSDENAKKYLASIEKHFKSSSKFYATTLMDKLIKIRYDMNGNVHDHVMEVVNIAANLKDLKMGVSDGFVAHFIIRSVPQYYEAFKVNYNTLKEKWPLSDFITMCVQEERVKVKRRHVVNYLGHGKNNGQGNYKGKRKGNNNEIIVC